MEDAFAKLCEHGRPGRVELVRRSRTATAGDPVGLLDEHDAHSGLERRVLRGHEVRRADSAARSVPEDERRRGLVDQVEVRPRRADRSLQLEDEPSLAGQPRPSSSGMAE